MLQDADQLALLWTSVTPREDDFARLIASMLSVLTKQKASQFYVSYPVSGAASWGKKGLSNYPGRNTFKCLCRWCKYSDKSSSKVVTKYLEVENNRLYSAVNSMHNLQSFFEEKSVQSTCISLSWTRTVVFGAFQTNGKSLPALIWSRLGQTFLCRCMWNSPYVNQ